MPHSPALKNKFLTGSKKACGRKYMAEPVNNTILG
jgi:hypothetical protein